MAFLFQYIKLTPQSRAISIFCLKIYFLKMFRFLVASYEKKTHDLNHLKYLHAVVKNILSIPSKLINPMPSLLYT